MKREIKFRGKSLKSGGWLIGSHFYDGSLHYILTNSITGAEDYEGCVVSENTVGQFTGLKDKRGNEIFEGDIVQDGWDCINLVVWDEETGGLYFKSENGVFSTALDTEFETMLVIGNLYDNPELWKGGEP